MIIVISFKTLTPAIFWWIIHTQHWHLFVVFFSSSCNWCGCNACPTKNAAWCEHQVESNMPLSCCVFWPCLHKRTATRVGQFKAKGINGQQARICYYYWLILLDWACLLIILQYYLTFISDCVNNTLLLSIQESSMSPVTSVSRNLHCTTEEFI